MMLISKYLIEVNMFKKISSMILLFVLMVSWNNESINENVFVSKKSDKITFTVSENDITVSKSFVKDYIPKDKNDYMGCYSFGYSEGEYVIRFILNKKGIIMQKTSYEITPKDQTRFIKVYENIEFDKLNNNKFVNKKYEGTFIEVTVDKKIQKGLLLKNLKLDISEFPNQYINFEKCLEGKYKKTFYKYLTKDDIKDLSLKELKIMRNEIFARYNYKFKAGGEMSKYFSSKPWYRAENSNVDRYLTKIEKANVSFLKKEESLKK
jgi:hypothetical protein